MGNTTSAPKVTSQDRAILQLKLQRDKLHRATTKIQVVIDRENEIARQCVQEGKRNKALLALKKRKYQENLLDTVEKQLDTLETLISTIEFKLIEKDVVYGLQQGNQVLKQLNTELSMEKVDKIMDDTAEGVEYQEELGRRLGELMPRSLDEEVDEEMERLEREARGEVEESVPQKVVDLPEAPKEAPETPEAPKQKVEQHEQHEPQALPA